MHPVLFHIGAVLIPSYGALAAIGLLLALALAQRTARVAGVHPAHVWNLCVIALFAGLIVSRLVLLAVNWRDVLRHPLWMIGLATIHNPLVMLIAVAAALVAAWLYARAVHLPLLPTADALAAPAALGAACEQIGALLAGSGFGTPTHAGWAVTYTSLLAERWSGAPIGIPVHPVQAYAAIAFLTLSLLILVILPVRRQAGDACGTALIGAGITVYLTEIWRDWEGRGSVLGGALDAPQIAAVVLVLIGALLLRHRNSSGIAAPHPTEARHA